MMALFWLITEGPQISWNYYEIILRTKHIQFLLEGKIFRGLTCLSQAQLWPCFALQLMNTWCLLLTSDLSVRLASIVSVIVTEIASQSNSFSYVHHCAARSRHDSQFSHLRQCQSPLTSPKAISSSVAMRAGRSWLRWPVHRVLNNSVNYLGLRGLVQQLQDQSSEPRCGLMRGVLTEQWIESNWIESTRLWHWIESFSFLWNRPSLVTGHQDVACVANFLERESPIT